MLKALALIVLLSLEAGGAKAAEPSAKPAQPFLDMQPVGVPAVVDGRLVNYVFVDLRLVIRPGVDPARLQEKEPFLRDALVRAAARRPFNLPGNGIRLDEARLRAETMSEATRMFGPGKVVRVEIKSETPQRRSGVPGGAS